MQDRLNPAIVGVHFVALTLHSHKGLNPLERSREQTLIRNAQRGDQKAFSALYRANVDKIYRYIFHRVDSAQVAEDLTADVFLRMVEGLKAYQDRNMPLLVWLYRIAHARVVDHYRRNERRGGHEDIEAIDIASDEEDIDEQIDLQFDKAYLQKALAALTSSQRQVVVLRFIEGHNLEQTAQIMQKSVDAIKAMQYRALQSLAAAFKARAEGNE